MLCARIRICTLLVIFLVIPVRFVVSEIEARKFIVKIVTLLIKVGSILHFGILLTGFASLLFLFFDDDDTLGVVAFCFFFVRRELLDFFKQPGWDILHFLALLVLIILLLDQGDHCVKTFPLENRVLVIGPVNYLLDEVGEQLVLDVDRVIAEEAVVELLVALDL